MGRGGKIPWCAAWWDGGASIGERALVDGEFLVEIISEGRGEGGRYRENGTGSAMRWRRRGVGWAHLGKEVSNISGVKR